MPIVIETQVQPQLDLFATGMPCSYCGNDPGRDPRNGVLWHGFLDIDTGQHVCWQCKAVHYHKKIGPDGKTTYSEMPLMVDHKMF